MNNAYLDVNRELWDRRTEIHTSSAFYDVPAFIGGRSSLNKPETDLLKDIRGKSALHLQCHFGLDTLSLARMGATVTGVDFSPKAIDAARSLADRCGLAAEFLCCDLYSLPEIMNREFDIVFTSYGTIGWLPDLERWAGIVNRSLKPGGKFIFAEFHPAVWMFDHEFTEVIYSYFRSDAIVEEEGSYADPALPTLGKSITWNHSIGEVFTALAMTGLQIYHLQEYSYSSQPFLENMTSGKDGMYRHPKFGDKLPLVYTLAAIKTVHTG